MIDRFAMRSTSHRLAAPESATTSFEYDPFGRRLRKTINSTSTDYLYDGANPAQELSGTTVDANMLDGLNVDEYFQRADLLGTWDYLNSPLGSQHAAAVCF